MDGIKAWVLSVAVASVMAGIVYILTPKGSTQKIVRISIFTFIICSSISPLITGEIELDFDLPELKYESSEEEKLISKIEESMEALVVKNMNEILKAMGVDNAQIKIITDKNSDNSISITETVITVPEQYMSMSEDIRLKIKSELGYDVRVTV